MRNLALLTGLTIALGACGSDPLSHKVDDSVINALPAAKLGLANKLKAEAETAKKNWEAQKLLFKLSEMELEMAEKYREAAKTAVKAVREKLTLQNKGVKINLPPGALDKAMQEDKLAEKNLEYRKLAVEYHEKKAKQLEMQYHERRAAFFEEIVKVVHDANHAKAKDLPKSKFMSQAAEMKQKAAETMGEVEKDMAKIKALRDEIEKKWAPSLSCVPTTAPGAPTSGESK